LNTSFYIVCLIIIIKCLCLCSLPAEVEVKNKSSSLPVPASAAYRTSDSSHLMPPVQPLLPSPSEDQPHSLMENKSHEQEASSESTRQSLQKRIQLLQDHNLSLLSHIKMFRDVIDKVSIFVLCIYCNGKPLLYLNTVPTDSIAKMFQVIQINEAHSLIPHRGNFNGNKLWRFTS